MQRNDRFIISAVIAGLINRVIWIQPDWAHPKYIFSDQAAFIGTVIPGKGRELGKESENEMLCFCYYQTRIRTASEDMFCGYFSSQESDDLSEIPGNACKQFKLFSLMTISESLFRRKFNNKSLKEKHVILDIDEDYFGVQSGVQFLIDAGIPLDVIYVIDEILPQLFCPNSIMAEQALDKDLRAMFGSLHELLSKNKKKSRDTIRIVLKHVGKHICHKNDDRKSTIFETFISYLDSKLTVKIASALSNTKYCLFNSLQLKIDYSKLPDNKTSDFSLCHGVLFPGDKLNEIFVETRAGGIQKRGKRLSKMLNHIFERVTPKIITIARSLRDGYVPRKQQRLIEHTVRKAIETNLSKRFMKSKTIFDENLVGGKEGWNIQALEIGN